MSERGPEIKALNHIWQIVPGIDCYFGMKIRQDIVCLSRRSIKHKTKRCMIINHEHNQSTNKH